MNSVTNLKEGQGLSFTPLLKNEDPYQNQSSVKKEV